MISSETIEIVYSNVMVVGTFSEEEPDYRVLDQVLRVTDDNLPRETDGNDLRIIES